MAYNLVLYVEDIHLNQTGMDYIIHEGNRMLNELLHLNITRWERYSDKYGPNVRSMTKLKHFNRRKRNHLGHLLTPNSLFYPNRGYGISAYHNRGCRKGKQSSMSYLEMDNLPVTTGRMVASISSLFGVKEAFSVEDPMVSFEDAYHCAIRMNNINRYWTYYPPYEFHWSNCSRIWRDAWYHRQVNNCLRQKKCRRKMVKNECIKIALHE